MRFSHEHCGGDGYMDAMLEMEDEMERAYLADAIEQPMPYNFFTDSTIQRATNIEGPASGKSSVIDSSIPVKPEATYFCRGCRTKVLGKYLSEESYCPECQQFADYCKSNR